MSDSMPPPDSPPPPPDWTGRTIGDFQILRKLGQGGMGQVYLARQLSLKRDVALKILRNDLADNPTALKRFQAEAEAVARMTHANIVQVYAVGEQDGLRYMALEYVEGRNLRDYLARKGPPELPIALSIMRQVAGALQRSSESGIIHRDIKPENILITRKVEVKVADFGLSRYTSENGMPLNLTQSNVTLGTPLYMSPEQVQGQPADHRSDIYSFGVTCYHMLAGEPPFKGASAYEVLYRHVQEEPVPLAQVRPDLPADLSAIVHRMMAKKPADRYQTAREIIRDLVKVARGLSVEVPAKAASASTSASGMNPIVPSAISGTAQVIPPGPGVGVWIPRLLGMLVFAGLAALGWWSYSQFHRVSEVGPTPTGPGLPEVRSPEPVIASRERDLRERIRDRSAKPAEIFAASLELGMMYVRDRRLDDADRVFKEMENERPERVAGFRGLVNSSAVAGKLGQAVVLAQRDRAKESIEQFDRVLAGPPRLAPLQLGNFLLGHPELAQMVADALHRNAENLNTPKLPDRFEWLRSPAGLTRGPKG